MIEILRLSHRILRDKRISTHVALVSRALGASKIYYTGQKDSEMENSVNKISKQFGGNFSVSHIKNYKTLFKNKTIVHLTMYGLDYKEKLKELKGNILVIIGGEKVPPEIYSESHYNLSVTSQPHSEVAALGIFLDHLIKKKPKFKGKINITPSLKGKVVN